MASPASASPTATTIGAVSPRPAASTTPPSQAPSALAMLKAEWFSAAPSVWASPATSISRICKPVGRISAIPRKNTVIGARIGLALVNANVPKIAAIARNAPIIARCGRQSISRPAIRLPATIPAPQTASTTGTRPTFSPARSVRIGEM
jgi:hypothetical protein